MTLDEKVRTTLLHAGFSESRQESTGFEIYSSRSDSDVVLLHVQQGITKQELVNQLVAYRQALAAFHTELLPPVIRIREKASRQQ